MTALSELLELSPTPLYKCLWNVKKSAWVKIRSDLQKNISSDDEEESATTTESSSSSTSVTGSRKISQDSTEGLMEAQISSPLQKTLNAKRMAWMLRALCQVV